MDQYALEALISFGAVTGIGFLAGLSRTRFPLAATLVGWATVFGYLVLLAVVGAWVADCPGCESFQSYDSPRALDLIMAFVWGGIFTLTILGFIQIGGLVSGLIGNAGRKPR